MKQVCIAVVLFAGLGLTGCGANTQYDANGDPINTRPTQLPYYQEVITERGAWCVRMGDDMQCDFSRGEK